MTAGTVTVTFYASGSLVATSGALNLTALNPVPSSAWGEMTADITYTSLAYDEIRVAFVNGAAGLFNIEELSIYLPCE